VRVQSPRARSGVAHASIPGGQFVWQIAGGKIV